ncbi:hypothetical protein GCM10025867_27750 [Frondihabitans sucicola]|uniref:Uncharacterized protein n=1 Tax=Frondihabitans sucicola TaxID=1268041 RepID=A0ABM8GQ41_9MICO|nr:hypothetical protein [Frondihabitans sucicola]BDZ50534.1 hypothetical protein GCM10025867_27750 [Frondihabitans sucicola]
MEGFVSILGLAVLVLARILLVGTGYGDAARARRHARRAGRAAAKLSRAA